MQTTNIHVFYVVISEAMFLLIFCLEIQYLLDTINFKVKLELLKLYIIIGLVSCYEVFVLYLHNIISWHFNVYAVFFFLSINIVLKVYTVTVLFLNNRYSLQE